MIQTVSTMETKLKRDVLMLKRELMDISKGKPKDEL